MSHTVSRNALIKRINRKLAHEGEVLKTLRGERWLSDLGYHYIVNDRNCLVAGHVDPGELGRDLGVLKEHERVAETS